MLLDGSTLLIKEKKSNKMRNLKWLSKRGSGGCLMQFFAWDLLGWDLVCSSPGEVGPY